MYSPKGEHPKTRKTEEHKMKIKDLLDRFKLMHYRTAITREDFETYFRRTNEKITFSFNGWDGKSYNGESRTAYVYRSTINGFGEIRFIKVGKSLHSVEDKTVLEKATGEYHNGVSWFIDVLRK